MSMGAENENDILEQNKINNPIGTKILLEVEIMKENGHNLLTAAMFTNKEKFEELTGCCINAIYKKEVKINNTNTLGDLINNLKEHYEKLIEEGRINNA